MRPALTVRCVFSVCLVNGDLIITRWSVHDNQTDHLHHLWVVKVVDDVFQDVSVRHEPQRSKYDDDGNFLSDVRQRGDNPLTNGALLHSLRVNQYTINEWIHHQNDGNGVHYMYSGLTCPPRAIMLTQMVLVGRDEFSKQDRHSPV